jgi:hypothetical protein
VPSHQVLWEREMPASPVGLYTVLDNRWLHMELPSTQQVGRAVMMMIFNAADDDDDDDDDDQLRGTYRPAILGPATDGAGTGTLAVGGGGGGGLGGARLGGRRGAMSLPLPPKQAAGVGAGSNNPRLPLPGPVDAMGLRSKMREGGRTGDASLSSFSPHHPLPLAPNRDPASLAHLALAGKLCKARDEAGRLVRPLRLS